MEISQYVISAVSSVNMSKTRHDYQAARDLMTAAENAEDNNDSYILKLVSGILSMSYSVDKHEFSPLFIFDGRRSFSSEDITPTDVETIEKMVSYTTNMWVRTRLAHVAWILTGKHQYGQCAVTGYLQQFEESFDPEHWVDCNDAIQCAFNIAARLGKKSDSYKQTRTAINKKIIAMDGSDPLFLSISLLNLVIKDATPKEMEAYLAIVAKLAAKNICAKNDNTHLADETFGLQEMLLKRLKRQDEINVAVTNYASYYENFAEVLANREDYYRAVIMLKKACTLYSTIDRNKLLVLRSRLEELQKKALKQMNAIPFKINTESTYKLVKELFDGLSPEESIVQIGRLATVYKVEDVKQQLAKKSKEHVFSSMFGSCLVNEKGQTVEDLPPLSEANDNPEVMLKHMVRHVAEQRRLIESITLGYAFDFLRQAGNIEEDTLSFLVSDNAIIPENREKIIKEGLYFGLTGKLYAALHILLPQTENIFRNLVAMCGDTVTFLKEDGTESYKPLSSLFKSDALIECYSEDILFTFQSILDEPIGENLRNLNAHGLLEPNMGNSTSALCFLCLLIKLLVMYSPNVHPILKKLAERDAPQTAE